MKARDKIKELETWLVNNPEHPDYCLVWQDKNKLETELLKKKNDKTRTTTTL